jgi:hypothetical protein
LAWQPKRRAALFKLGLTAYQKENSAKATSDEFDFG